MSSTSRSEEKCPEFIEGHTSLKVIDPMCKASPHRKWMQLTKLYGVGPETARILLFEVCHQYNTFDHIAPWQQKIYSRLFYKKSLVPTNKIRDDIKKQYGKYSMLAVHYIWEDIFGNGRTKKLIGSKKKSSFSF